MLTYFWLNYCDENHIQRIPVTVKNIDHLFHLASQIIKADRLHLFLLSDGTRMMIMIKKPRKRYRIDYLYGGTNPEIARGKTVKEKPGKSKATESSQGKAQRWWRPSRA